MMVTEHELELSAAGTALDRLTETVKTAFHAWISAEHKTHIDPDILISSLDITSEQLL